MKKLLLGFASPLILIIAVLAIGCLASIAYFQFKLKSESQPRQTTTFHPTEVSQSNSTVNETTNWKTHTNDEGKYTVQYPPDWVLELFKEKYPYNSRYDKGHIVFQTRATTDKERADDAPGLPVDMATGSIKIITTESMRETEYSKISEQNFFNPDNDFWLKGDAGGGGPGTTFSVPKEVSVGGKRAMKQSTHPTTAYEWVAPSQITINYYAWLGNPSNEVLEISFTYDDKNPNKDTLTKYSELMISTLKITD